MTTSKNLRHFASVAALAGAMGVTGFAVTAHAQDSAGNGADKFESDIERFSYFVGHDMAQGLLQFDDIYPLEGDFVVAAITDVLSDNEIKLTDAEIEATAVEFQEAFQAAAIRAAEAEAAEVAANAAEYLEENAKKEGVTVTDSGLQYEVLEAGEEDAAMPTAEDSVTVHYTGMLPDGTVFDSSVERGEPATFPLNGVIEGWTEGVQLMPVGSKYKFTIPSDLAYGPTGNPQGGIPGGATLVFDVELLEINPAE